MFRQLEKRCCPVNKKGENNGLLPNAHIQSRNLWAAATAVILFIKLTFLILDRTSAVADFFRLLLFNEYSELPIYRHVTHPSIEC